MGCGCGGKKTAGERAAVRQAAGERQAARRDPRTYWNGPARKSAKKKA